MARIAGVDLPNEKRLDIALTYLYGVGRSNVVKVLKEAQMDGARRVKTLTDEEVNKIAKILEKGYTVAQRHYKIIMAGVDQSTAVDFSILRTHSSKIVIN